jgi:hypothetical protein
MEGRLASYQATNSEFSKRHILIAGTGRAGTTLLVQLFTALGFDTGFTLDEALNNVDEISRAGLETNPRKDRLAQVVKAPALADHISELLARPGFEVEAAIVPMRELHAAAESRRRVYRLAKSAGYNPLKHPGSLWKTRTLHEQEEKLALQFYRFIQPIIALDQPLFLLDFPRFVQDSAYLFSMLQPIFDARGISEVQVAEAVAKVARPELVNDFATKRSLSDFAGPRFLQRLFGLQQQSNYGTSADSRRFAARRGSKQDRLFRF